MTYGATPPSHGDPLGPLQQGDLSLPYTMVDVAPQHTQGATGRIWSMPYRILKSIDMNPSSPILQISADTLVTVQNTLTFLTSYAADQLSDWTETHGRSLNPSHKKLIDSMLEFGPPSPPEQALRVAQKTQAPRVISVPKIDSDHWAYRDHYELGHFKSASDDLARDCAWEARSDVASILSYLSHYKDLAENYCGLHLARATQTPSFTAPYCTCMALCVFTLKLPSHFLALIHHGIALQFIERARTPVGRSAMSLGAAPDTSPNPLFDLLARLYVEDFAS